MQNNPKFFEKKIIRTAWNEQEEEWFQPVTNCNQLKMLSADGKMRLNYQILRKVKWNL